MRKKSWTLTPEEGTVRAVLGGEPLGEESPAETKRESYGDFYGAVQSQLESVCVLIEADPQEDAKPG